MADDTSELEHRFYMKKSKVIAKIILQHISEKTQTRQFSVLAAINDSANEWSNSNCRVCPSCGSQISCRSCSHTLQLGCSGAWPCFQAGPLNEKQPQNGKEPQSGPQDAVQQSLSLQIVLKQLLSSWNNFYSRRELQLCLKLRSISQLILMKQVPALKYFPFTVPESIGKGH